MKKVIIGISIPLLLAVTLFTCQKQEEKKEKQSEKVIDESAIAVSLSPVQEEDVSLPVISSGLVTTENEARLSFKVGGIVSKILVEEGQSVSKGQLLASLDLTEINAQVAQAKNNFEKTKRDLERGQRLYRDSAATLEQIQNLQTAFDVAAEGLQIAYFNQSYSTIKATTSGKVIRKFVNEGEVVGAGSPILLINGASQNEWIVRVGIPDVDWVRIRKGDKALVTTDTYAGATLNAEVSSINEGAELISGLYQVEIKIKSTEKKLASGLVAKVEIQPSQKQLLKFVPIEAIIEGNGKHAYVFTANVDANGVKKIPVTVAFLKNNFAYVSDGLTGVTEVITGGSAFLTENSIVKIQNTVAVK